MSACITGFRANRRKPRAKFSLFFRFWPRAPSFTAVSTSLDHTQDIDLKGNTMTNAMTKVLVKLNLRRSEKGATAVEYGLMVALIAIVIIAAVALVGGALDDLFNEVAASL